LFILGTGFSFTLQEKGQMNRRDVLKALAAMPLISALGCKSEDHQPPAVAPPSGARVRTVQVLFEGAFALVLQKNNPNQLTAFIPKADAGHDLDHDFFFNDPVKAKAPTVKDPAGYNFKLSASGLRNYQESYVNPGFHDFLAETEKWILPARVATITLPFPNSINFAGRPLHVTFSSGKKGVMPTNHILEYYVDDPDKVKMSCSELGGGCEASPHCPPGVLRFFFGAAPQMKDEAAQRKHAVDFFNFTLRKAFPDLVEKYSIIEIEPSEERTPQQPANARPSSMPQISADLFKSAVMRPDQTKARLLPVSETVDCQVGGILVRTSKPPLQ
jgi:hypothetical protein